MRKTEKNIDPGPITIVGQFTGFDESIENGLGKGISVRELATASRISRRTLEYAFRDRYGISPKVFINSQRLGQGQTGFTLKAS